MKNRTLFILLLVIALLSFGWQNYIQPLLATYTESTVELRPRETRHSVPDFSLFDLGGNAVRLSDYRGAAVFIGFWATW
ncbi:MAG: redoxin domain-containing protein [Deltaproteobacteria bacterium]|nr:redoxin domain-containing protein [Deltaproteobacteria bacterium]